MSDLVASLDRSSWRMSNVCPSPAMECDHVRAGCVGLVGDDHIVRQAARKAISGAEKMAFTSFNDSELSARTQVTSLMTISQPFHFRCYIILYYITRRPRAGVGYYDAKRGLIYAASPTGFWVLQVEPQVRARLGL